VHKKRYIFKFASEVTTEIKKQGLCCIVLLFSFDLKTLISPYVISQTFMASYKRHGK